MKYFGTVWSNSLKKTLVLLCFISLFTVLSGQQELPPEAPPIRQRLFFGGSFALQFGTVTNIELSPIIGFWVLPNLAVAAGPEFTFYKDQYNRTEIYGLKSYVQFLVFRDLNKFLPLGIHTSLFLHLEDELLSLDSDYWTNMGPSSGRFYVNTLLGGAGISQQIGPRGSINFMVLWTLTDPGYQLYSNPEFRIGFTF